MRNFLQAMAIIGIGYAIYHGAANNGLSQPAAATDALDEAEYNESSHIEQDAGLPHTDEESMLAEFERVYAPPNGCDLDSRETRCLEHRVSALNHFRPMWKNYFTHRSP